jgi:hypothetical protein
MAILELLGECDGQYRAELRGGTLKILEVPVDGRYPSRADASAVPNDEEYALEVLNTCLLLPGSAKSRWVRAR